MGTVVALTYNLLDPRAATVAWSLIVSGKQIIFTRQAHEQSAITCGLLHRPTTGVSRLPYERNNFYPCNIVHC